MYLIVQSIIAALLWNPVNLAVQIELGFPHDLQMKEKGTELKMF